MLKLLLSLEHDYSHISLNIPPLSFLWEIADFIIHLHKLDNPDFLSNIFFRISTHKAKDQNPFYIPTHFTSYSHNHTLHRMVRVENLD